MDDLLATPCGPCDIAHERLSLASSDVRAADRRRRPKVNLVKIDFRGRTAIALSKSLSRHSAVEALLPLLTQNSWKTTRTAAQREKRQYMSIIGRYRFAIAAGGCCSGANRIEPRCRRFSVPSPESAVSTVLQTEANQHGISGETEGEREDAPVAHFARVADALEGRGGPEDADKQEEEREACLHSDLGETCAVSLGRGRCDE